MPETNTLQDFLGGTGDGAALGRDLVKPGQTRDQQITTGLEGLLGSLFNAKQEGAARHQSALGRILGSINTNRRDFESTQQGLNQGLFARESDRINQSAQGGLRSLRASLGLSGVGGGSGAAQGLAGNLESQRRTGITGAKRDVALASAQRRLNFNQGEFQNTFGAAQFENEGNPNELLGADAFAFLTNTRLGMLGIDAQESASRRAAKSAKKAGKLNFLGGLVGGLF